MALPSGKQIIAARALAGWDQADLAERVGVTKSAISAIENETNRSSKTLEKIETAFVNAGFEFLLSGGVQPKQSLITFYGQQGYWDFYDDVYRTLRAQGGEILVNNVDELLFTKWLGERGMTHKKRMYDLSQEMNFSLKILIKEGDTNFTVPEYAEYRWTPEERFSEIPFYVYGDKLGIMIFEEDGPNVFVLNNPKISQAYTKQFNVIWDQALIIPDNQIKPIKGVELDD